MLVEILYMYESLDSRAYLTPGLSALIKDIFFFFLQLIWNEHQYTILKQSLYDDWMNQQSASHFTSFINYFHI